MAELEIRAEAPQEVDPGGQKVGVQAAVLAVLLAIVSIASHRSHARAVVLQAEANDQWSYHQSKRIKYHSLELGVDLISLLASEKPESQKLLERYRAEEQRYVREGAETQAEARRLEGKVHQTERKALAYDIGEGLLEIALVLTSLYFIARKRLFPTIGVVAGVTGLAMATAGLFF